MNCASSTSPRPLPRLLPLQQCPAQGQAAEMDTDSTDTLPPEQSPSGKWVQCPLMPGLESPAMESPLAPTPPGLGGHISIWMSRSSAGAGAEGAALFPSSARFAAPWPCGTQTPEGIRLWPLALHLSHCLLVNVPLSPGPAWRHQHCHCLETPVRTTQAPGSH